MTARIWIVSSMVLVLTLASDACGRRPPPDAGPVIGHEHHAPHGGALVELGEEFAHLEMLFDKTSGQITLFVLDGEAENPVRLPDARIVVQIEAAPNSPAQLVDLEPRANVLTGETVGDSSQFGAARQELLGRSELKGLVTAVTVKGQAFHDLPFLIPASGTGKS